MSDVKIFRLMTGEEIIASSSDGSKLMNPFILNFMTGESQGQVGIQMGPLAPFAEKDKSGNCELELVRTSVAFIYVPDEQIIDNYLRTVQQLTSSLVLPEKSGKIIVP